MIYLMNSAVMPAGNYGAYTYRPASLDDLKSVVRGELGPRQSAIGYQQNCELIERWTGVRPDLARTETRFRQGDRALVMRMLRRAQDPASKGAPVREDLDSWEFAWVELHAELIC